MLEFDFDDFGFGTYSVSARAYDPTEWVRGNRSDLEQTVTWTVINNTRLNGGFRDDVLTGNEVENRIEGRGGADVLYGAGGSDELLGGAEADRLYGESGNDTLHGGSGLDTLYGGTGNDTLYGDSGNDTLYGGTEGDFFVYDFNAFGIEVIADFSSAAGDRVWFDNDVATDFTTVRSLMRQVGADTLIDFGNGNAITLLNIGLATLTASQFQFGLSI